jgi:hypothetical protein
MSHPTPIIASLVQYASATAASLGHTLEPWARDSLRSRFTFCASCGLAAVVTIDQGEPERYIGSCLSGPCSPKVAKP